MTHPTLFRGRLLALVAALLFLAGAAAVPAAAQESRAGDTSAVAINTKDGSSLFKLAFEIRKVTGDVVDNQNAAVAYSSCTDCQTVAISIQVLLVAGAPDTVSPENVAVALNENCTSCQTLASAYQFAVGGATELRFTKDGRQQISDLRRELRDLGRSDLTVDEIQARVRDITTRLKGVLATELVGVKPGDDDEDEDDQDDDERSGKEPSGTTGPGTPTPSGTTGPSGADDAAGAEPEPAAPTTSVPPPDDAGEPVPPPATQPTTTTPPPPAAPADPAAPAAP